MRDQKIARGPLLIIVGLAALAVVSAGVLYGKFSYSELCTVCGRARDVVEWQVPATKGSLYTLREERPTTLSGMLEKRQLVETHDHQWQFVRGTGNGQTIVLGAGHPISWSLLSPHMGPFMEQIFQLTDRSTTLRMLNQLREPTYSRLGHAMAAAASGRTFKDRTELENWQRDFETEHALLVLQAEPK